MTTALHADLVPFLIELTDHNDRDWFQSQRSRYEQHVQGSLLAFLEALAPRMAAEVSPHIAVVAKKVGGSLHRLNRDTRFGKDKRPYHDHVSARFVHAQATPAAAPGYYLRVSPSGITLGAGLWQPETPALDKVRAAIDTRQDAWVKARDDKAFRKLFGTLQGESLKRPPRGVSADHPLLDDLRRKDFVAFRELPAELAARKKFLDTVVETYAAARPCMAFLCKALELKF